MRIEKTIEVPAATRTEAVGIRCDLCGQVSHTGHWGLFNHQTDEVTVCRHDTTNTPYDGGRSRTFEVDLCPDCFARRLIPWLESQGAEVRVTESDW